MLLSILGEWGQCLATTNCLSNIAWDWTRFCHPERTINLALQPEQPKKMSNNLLFEFIITFFRLSLSVGACLGLPSSWPPKHEATIQVGWQGVNRRRRSYPIPDRPTDLLILNALSPCALCRQLKNDDDSLSPASLLFATTSQPHRRGVNSICYRPKM